MKRFLTVLLAVLLAGCGAQNYADDGAAAVTQSELALSLQAYRDVLENEKTVYTESSQKEVFFGELMEDEVSIAKYSILDMDGDSLPEVVLRMRYGTNDTYGFRVLHFEEGTVYLFYFPYRGLNGLKADGTFHWAAAASNNGDARIDFAAGTYTETNLAYCESDYDGNVSYYIGDKSVSKEEYAAFCEEQSNKPDAEWHEYTTDNFARSIASFTADTERAE